MKKAKTITIIIAVLLLAAFVVCLTFQHLFFTYRAEISEYDGTDRDSVGYLPTSEQVASAVTYDRVVIFGVDGAGAYFGEGVTPNFERIFANGSVTFEGISQHPTISGENWASMFTGLKAQNHKINNTISGIFPNTYATTIFKVLHEYDKDATFYSACNWGNINYGIIENNIKITKAYCAVTLSGDADKNVKNHVVRRVQNHDDLVTFMQFDNVDHVGHSYGYGSPEFAEAVKVVDGYIGEIYDAYVEQGLADSTLFICVSDHGHSLTGGHGGESDTEKYVTFAVAGGKGNIIPGTMGKFVTQDLASVVLYALGVEQPDTFESRVPANLFTTLCVR